MKALSAIVLLPFLLAVPARAVLTGGTYVTTATGDSTAGNVAVDSYVGTLNGASAVYLGDGWIISAAHVGGGAGTSFTLDGQGYTLSAAVSIASGVDLQMFHLTGGDQAATDFLSTLGTLALASGPPAAGAEVVMVGYGNGGGALSGMKTWGSSTVADLGGGVTTELVPVTTLPPDPVTYTSTDFISLDSSTYVVPGDSGGGAFVKSGSTWILAGLLEAQEQDGNGNPAGSAIVNLSTYTSTINTVIATTAVPEPGTWALLGAGLVAVCWRARRADKRFTPSRSN